MEKSPLNSQVDVILCDDFANPDNAFKEMSSNVMSNLFATMKKNIFCFYINSEKGSKKFNVNKLSLEIASFVLFCSCFFIFSFNLIYAYYLGANFAVPIMVFAVILSLFNIYILHQLLKIVVSCHRLKKYAMNLHDPLTVINTFSILINSKYSSVKDENKESVFAEMMLYMEENNRSDLSSFYDTLLFASFKNYISSINKKNVKIGIVDNISIAENKRKLFTNLLKK